MYFTVFWLIIFRVYKNIGITDVIIHYLTRCGTVKKFEDAEMEKCGSFLLFTELSLLFEFS